MTDSRPLTRRAKTMLLFTFMALSLVWPLIVPGEQLIAYAYLIGGVTAAGLGFQAGIDWQKAKGGIE
jgi:hypothetical protein